MHWITNKQKISDADHEKVSRLLDKYMCGETSGDEEERLRVFFAKHTASVPEKWKPYAAMFGYVVAEKSAKSPVSRRNHIVLWLSAAASVMILVGLSTVWLPERSECYMVVNGKTITDRSEVRAEAMEALRMVGENDGEPFEAMSMMR